jgi:hypothetical protein
MDGDILQGMLYGGCLRVLHQLDQQYPSSSTHSPLFDFIDVSNMSDHVSLPAVVQAGLPLLKVEKHAVLHAESFTWHMKFNTREPRQFLKCCVGMDLEIYQELLGVSVQTQVVGSFKPLLRTQWTWNLRETTLTGAMVMFEFMTAAKLYCTTDRAKYVADSGVHLNSDDVFAGFVAGIDSSSPLTMLHLLHLCCPGIALPIVRALVAANDACSTRKWELMCHATFQQDPLKAFDKVVFQAKVKYTTLCACPEASPLCLMVSKAPVTVTWAPVDVVTDLVQLLEAFSYSLESDLVEVMLPHSVLIDPECQSYFITLCALTDSTFKGIATSTKLQAVGSSVPWPELSSKPLTAPLPSWATCEAIAKRALLSNDLELLELIASDNDDSPPQPWKTHAVLETNSSVIVELLLPRPLPGPDKVALSVTSSGQSLKVSATAVVIKKETDTADPIADSTRQQDFVFSDQEHIVELPAAISSGEHKTKLSRKLGIMIVRLPKVV